MTGRRVVCARSVCTLAGNPGRSPRARGLVWYSPERLPLAFACSRNQWQLERASPHSVLPRTPTSPCGRGHRRPGPLLVLTTWPPTTAPARHCVPSFHAAVCTRLPAPCHRGAADKRCPTLLPGNRRVLCSILSHRPTRKSDTDTQVDAQVDTQSHTPQTHTHTRTNIHRHMHDIDTLMHTGGHIHKHRHRHTRRHTGRHVPTHGTDTHTLTQINTYTNICT